MAVVAFPARTDTGVTVAAAVEEFVSSIQVATTRAGYGQTLAQLTAAAGPRPVGTLTPREDRPADRRHVHRALPAEEGHRREALKATGGLLVPWCPS
jgi:hypothetical protein